MTKHFDKDAFNTNESVVAAALKSKFFCGYELLIKNGFRLKPAEDFMDIIVDFDKTENGKLRDIHIECASKSHRDYLKVTYSKCKVAHTTSDENRTKFNRLKVKVFKKIAAIEWIKLLLQTVAFSDSLQIIFDFERDSVDHVDPTMTKNCLGLCFHHIGDILIGAKGLLSGKSDDLCHVAGVLAHEICHYAMQLLYENNTNPYHEMDSANQTKFEKILRECEINKNSEDIIRLVFICDIELQHCELIVRVVQLMAKYSSRKDRKRLAKIQRNFSELFNYFKEKVVNDLKLKLPKMEAKLKIKEINEICGLRFDLEYETSSFRSETLGKIHMLLNKMDLKEKVQIFTSNCVRLTVKAIFTVFLNQNQLMEKFL